MYGFYITQKGTEKIATAIELGDRVDINTCAVGDGGDVEAERDYNITALKNETYRKTLDNGDNYSLAPDNEDVIMITTIIPDDAGELTINEVGYFDIEDDLIIYGVTKDKVHKNAGEGGQQYVVELVNFVEITNNQIEGLYVDLGAESIKLINGRLDELEPKVESLEESINEYHPALDERVSVLETDLEGMAEFLESRI